MKTKKTRGKFSPKSSEKASIDEINELLEGSKEAMREAGRELIGTGEAAVKVSKEGIEKVDTAKVKGMVNWPRELTAREEAQRERDCKVEYSVVVPTKMHAGLDESRRAHWVPQDVVQAMPQWTPKLQPVVDEVIMDGSSEKDLAAFMGTTARAEKEKIVEKMVKRVLKKLPDAKPDLVEKRIWGTLHALLIDQGVSNKSSIAKML